MTARKFEWLYPTIIVAVAVFCTGFAIFYKGQATHNNRAAESPATMPSGAVDLGNGRYIKYVERNGQTYAGVAFDMKREADAYKGRPGFYRDHARGLLATNDKRSRWIDEKQEEKDGRMVIIFRLMTPEEQRLADEVGQEMSRPLDIK